MKLQTNEDWEYMLNVMLNEVNGGAFGLPLLDNMTVREQQPSQMTASKGSTKLQKLFTSFSRQLTLAF